MRCERAKELILTDHMDKQIGSQEQEMLLAHLGECDRCREFQSSAKKTISDPFESIKEASPPDSVWLNIKKSIAQEESQQAQNPIADLLNRLRSIIILPKPVFATATVFAVLVMALVIVRLPYRDKAVLNNYLADQAEFLNSLDNGSIDSYDENYQDLGSDIEEFFL
ncbi:hypothetical protein ACFL0T_02005 [Candidatus Omnitrophota bacterium]